MKLTRLLAMLLALCLSIPSAFAAPVRDPQLEEMTIDLGLQTLVEWVAGAAVLSDVAGMEEALPPHQALVEGMLSLGVYNGILPARGEEKNRQVILPLDEIASHYDQIFTSGQYAAPKEALFPGLSYEAGGLKMDLSAHVSNPRIGAYIYSTAFDGETVHVKCDLYSYYEDYAISAENLPENGMTWLCHGEFFLHYAPEMTFGYTLDGFALSPVYLDGQLFAWQDVENTTYEYSVRLPAIFGLANDTADYMAWQTADGEAEMTIRVHADYQKSYDDTLSDFLLSNPGQTVTEQREFSQFFAVGEGAYTLWIIPESMNWAYSISLSFPAQRQAEFTLYAEFIRNSMMIWGLSNG